MVRTEYQELSSLCVLLKKLHVILYHIIGILFIYSDFTFTHNLELWGMVFLEIQFPHSSFRLQFPWSVKPLLLLVTTQAFLSSWCVVDIRGYLLNEWCVGDSSIKSSHEVSTTIRDIRGRPRHSRERPTEFMPCAAFTPNVSVFLTL